MTWKAAIETRMTKYSISKATLAAGADRSKSFITMLLHDDDTKRKTSMSMGTAEAIAKVLHTNGPQLWKEAKAEAL